MAVEIVVMNCYEAAEFESLEPWACISIMTEEEDWPEICEEQRIGMLQLAFADLETPLAGYDLFSLSDAYDILDFVSEVWDRAHVLLIHCEMGLSRSPAVAAAIAHLKWGDDEEWFGEPYIPNRLVYEMLLEAAASRSDYLAVDQ